MTPAAMRARIAHLEEHLQVGALLIERLTHECRRLLDENDGLKAYLTQLTATTNRSS